MSQDKIGRDPVIKIKDLTKSFQIGNHKIEALRGVNLMIYATDFAVIFGPSGCGKSTLLNIISGLDEPTSGEIKVRDTAMFNLNDDDRGAFRSKKMGIVRQMSDWVKSLNVVENVSLPLIIRGMSEKNAKKQAENIMNDLGISVLEKQRPTQLSGGEQQKTGLARALISDPWIILADEPTGNLDTTSSDEVIAILHTLNEVKKRTIILVTHNPAYWDIGNRKIEMRDGKIINDTKGNE